MNKFLIIYNPISGVKSNKNMIKKLEQRLIALNKDYKTIATEYKTTGEHSLILITWIATNLQVNEWGVGSVGLGHAQFIVQICEQNWGGAGCEPGYEKTHQKHKIVYKIKQNASHSTKPASHSTFPLDIFTLTRHGLWPRRSDVLTPRSRYCCRWYWS